MRHLIECPAPPEIRAKDGARVFRHELTREAGTKTTQDPVFLWTRVGSPKPNKTRIWGRGGGMGGIKGVWLFGNIRMGLAREPKGRYPIHRLDRPVPLRAKSCPKRACK